MKNWKSFTKRIIIEKPIELVYRSLTTKEKLEVWFLENADFKFKSGVRRKDETAQTDDHFSWKWNNWDFTEEGQVLEANGKDLISFTFGSGGNVIIKLNKKKGASEVVLTQYDIPTDDKSKMEYYVGCISGWTFWLANLKAYLEHGITLHAKGLNKEETKDLVNS